MSHKLRLGVDSFSDGDHGEPFSRIKASQALHNTISSAKYSYVMTLPMQVKAL